MTPTAEEYEAWREHPVTAWVLAGLSNIANGAMQQAMVTAWNAQTVDQAALDRAKMRHEAYSDMAALSYEDALALHPQPEPIPEEESDEVS